MTTVLRALEEAINLPFRLQPQAQGALAKVAGRVMRIHLTVPDRRFDLHFDRDRVRVTAPGEHYDVCLTGRVSRFVLLMRASPERMQETMAGHIRIEGDMDCALAIRAAFARATIDPEELLARALGDIPGHAVATAFKRLTQGLQRAGARLADNAVEFLQEEDRGLPTQGEVEVFLRAVDRLRDDTERLAQRVARLARS
ncbi:MAG: ubiquinone biosynthesis accessory factor UbiJ [Acidiferrobacter sp.]